MSTDSLAAWLRLTLIPGIGGETQRKLLAAFGLPETLFAQDAPSLVPWLGERAEQLLAFDARAGIERALQWAEQPGNHLIPLADPAYPRQLLEIPDPPTLLYVRGNPELLKLPAIAVVGSRNATPQGLRNANSFAHALATQGWSIVSGLALGIDAAAHRGALTAHGPTVAVIGTGADRLYPARNRELALDILASGAIVSEFPLGTPPLAGNFPRRNRIISGLSQGVLVVEAALESGSLITARQAAEQGREVFAIPGSIHSPVARGCHHLIRQGAKLVETASDIQEELPSFAQAPARKPLPLASDDEHPVLAALGHDPCTLDELVQRSGRETEILLSELLDLELAGLVAPLPGNRYQRLLPEAG